MKKIISIITWIIFIAAVIFILSLPYADQAFSFIWIVIMLLLFLRAVISDTLYSAYAVSSYKNKYGDNMIDDLIKSINKVKSELRFRKTGVLLDLSEEFEYLESHFNPTPEEIDTYVFENTKKELLNLSEKEQKQLMEIIVNSKKTPSEYAIDLLLYKTLDFATELESENSEAINKE